MTYLVSDIRLDDIDRGIRDGLRAVESLRTWVKGVDAYRTCDERERSLRAAEGALAKLSAVWPRAQSLIGAAAREYDAYVEREPEGCSCHLSAPCGYCMSQSDEDAA